MTGLLFLRTRLQPTNLFYGSMYFGALFFSVIHMMVNGLSELTLTVQRNGVFYKQASQSCCISPGRICLHESVHAGRIGKCQHCVCFCLKRCM